MSVSPPPGVPIGELGLPATVAGTVIQALAAVIVDRGANREEVIEALRNWNGEEDFWGGKRGLSSLVDVLEVELGIEYEP